MRGIIAPLAACYVKDMTGVSEIAAKREYHNKNLHTLPHVQMTFAWLLIAVNALAPTLFSFKKVKNRGVINLM
jgi:hypothetical protein